MSFDIEDIADEIKQVLIDNLGAKITEINALKTGSFDMTPVKPEAFFFQGLNEQVVNFDPFIVYGVGEEETVSDHGMTASIVTFEVLLVRSEQGVKEINRIMFRYRRALKEVFGKNFSLDNNGIKLRVITLPLISFKLLDSNEDYKAIGISLQTSIS